MTPKRRKPFIDPIPKVPNRRISDMPVGWPPGDRRAVGRDMDLRVPYPIVYATAKKFTDRVRRVYLALLGQHLVGELDEAVVVKVDVDLLLRSLGWPKHSQRLRGALRVLQEFRLLSYDELTSPDKRRVIQARLTLPISEETERELEPRYPGAEASEHSLDAIGVASLNSRAKALR